MKRTLRYYSLRFKRLQGHPPILARGIAIGLFVGTTPTMPLHTLLLLTLCLSLKGSKIAALVASWAVSNPLTFFLQYYACWLVGSTFFPGRLSWEKMQPIMAILTKDQGYAGFKQSLNLLGGLGIEASTVMLTGGITLATPIAILGYYYSLNFFTKRQNRRAIRAIRKYESCPD